MLNIDKQQQQQEQQINDVIADLTKVDQTNSSLNDNAQSNYQSTTLRTDNRQRCNYLPMFPTTATGLDEHLLLANVPMKQLSPDELMRRQHGAQTTTDALTLLNIYNDQDMLSVSMDDIKELATRLHVGESIIAFNADRLRRICYFLLELHEWFRRHVLGRKDVALKEPTPIAKQIAMVLEFFLQMDVDVFFMKTCSFRGAEPRSKIEGLFCADEEPQARYEMIGCGKSDCLCCQSMNESFRAIDFASSSKHQFLNGYTTYLNCPVTCTTTNIVYVITCPCGQFDYVDSTAHTIVEALKHHRSIAHQIIHDCLTGRAVLQRFMRTPESREYEVNRKMRLYQHLGRCSTALRLFLDKNPHYWCFVPLSFNEAKDENILYIRGLHTTVPQATFSMISRKNQHQQNVADCLNRVPNAPATYMFSHVQYQEQRFFFDRLLSNKIDQLPYMETDLFNMKTIAVLPDDKSILLRYFVETLFIIHGETKLNMICPIGINPKRHYGLPYHGQWWCANLKRPSAPSILSVVATIEMARLLDDA